MGAIDPETVTRLWDDESAALALYARQRCAAAEDVVQEAFLLLVRQPVAPENPVGWLYRVVRNLAINASRSAGRQGRREATVAHRGEPWFETSQADRLDAVAATEALGHLPVEIREVVVARVWGGLSFEEIGQLTGTSAATAHRNYQRGLASLRERLNVACLPKNPKKN